MERRSNDCRPVGASYFEMTPNQGLTPLAIDLSPVGAKRAATERRAKKLMFQIRPAGWAAGVPHGHMLAAFAFNVVADNARAQEAAASSATRRGDGFRRIV